MQCTWQDDNEYDAHAIYQARRWDGCWTCSQRILKNILFLHEMRGTGDCSSYWEYGNKGHGLEIPTVYIFAGRAKDAMQLKKRLKS